MFKQLEIDKKLDNSRRSVGLQEGIQRFFSGNRGAGRFKVVVGRMLMKVMCSY